MGGIRRGLEPTGLLGAGFVRHAMQTEQIGFRL